MRTKTHDTLYMDWLSSTGFMPHGHCFLWQSDILALHIVSDAVIALAYFSIPFFLTILARRRPNVPFVRLIWMFSIFIVSCGLTHIMSIVVIWYPLYWIEGYIKAFTAAASLLTAVVLAQMLPVALRLLSPTEVDRLHKRLQAALALSERSRKKYEREHTIARTLQQASLGEIPNRIGPLEISALYQPGVSDMEIGGDWFDAFSLFDGRVLVSIGDAAGKGLAASVIMSKMRQAVRAAAQVTSQPSDILDAADQALKLEAPDQFATAFVGIVDTAKNTLAYVSAGHPPPLVRHADGTVTELIAGGLPLGLRELDPDKNYHTITLPRGSLLVCFTDGLTESTRDYLDGERRLRETLMHFAVALSPNPAREINDLMLAGGGRDDVAVLTVRNGLTYYAGERWSFFIGDAEAAYSVRHALVGILRDRGATEDETFAAELVLGEFIGNVARHAGGHIDIRLDWLLGKPILHVLDEGPGFEYAQEPNPREFESESGRGLFLAEHMTSSILITRRPGGGTHAKAELSFRGPGGVPAA